MKKAIFIDKDGTLIKNVPYNVDTRLIEFEAHAIDALKAFQACGYELVIISNQPGIALEYFTEAEVLRVGRYISNRLEEQGVQLTGFYFCPHHAEGKQEHLRQTCYCRKPMPGLLLKAANELNIDLELSWMIGDILDDTEAGNRAGCKTILLNNGNETEWVLSKNRRPSYTCANWLEASAIIVQYANQVACVEQL